MMSTTKRLRILTAMRAIFYGLPNCESGGPLHITLDDGNVDDECLDFCEQLLADEEPAVRILGKAILDMLRTLTEDERVAWYDEWDEP
jgi:hypothetical protein